MEVPFPVAPAETPATRQKRSCRCLRGGAAKWTSSYGGPTLAAQALLYAAAFASATPHWTRSVVLGVGMIPLGVAWQAMAQKRHLEVTYSEAISRCMRTLRTSRDPSRLPRHGAGRARAPAVLSAVGGQAEEPSGMAACVPSLHRDGRRADGAHDRARPLMAQCQRRGPVLGQSRRDLTGSGGYSVGQRCIANLLHTPNMGR